MKSLSPSQRLALAAIALVLTLLSAASLFEAAARRPLWLDEYWGVHVCVVHATWRTLLLDGPSTQGSLHPFYYLLEKLLLIPWMPAPQRWWNLFLYFRLTTIFSFALSGAAIFYYGERLLSRLPAAPVFPARTLIAAGFALFFYNVQFAEYYAIEARPYSLWLLLSTLHFLLTLEALQRGWKSRGFVAAYGACSLFLCITASPGIFQLALSFGAIQLLHRRLGVAWAILPSVLASAYYMLDSQKWGYAPGGPWDYLQFMKEVGYKSFHARSGLVFFPVLAIALWRLWSWRRHRLARGTILYLLGLFSLTVVLAVACWWKGFLLASRQYIYLIPAYMLLYFVALHAVAELLETRLRKKLPWLGAGTILAVWAAVIVMKSVPELMRRAYDLPAAAERNLFFSENRTEPCVAPLGVPNEHEFETLNKKCRER